MSTHEQTLGIFHLTHARFDASFNRIAVDVQ